MLNNLTNNVFLHQTTVASNPGAATDFIYYVLEPYRLKVTHIQFDFATDANAANRIITLKAHDGSRDTYVVSPAGLVTANETVTVIFSTGIAPIDLSNVGFLASPLGDDFIVDFGGSIRSEILNIQAGDQITNIILTYDAVAALPST